MADDDDRSRCYFINLPGIEAKGFLCGRLGAPCVQCGDVSEVLCDFPLGDEGRTCDKPLCLKCAPEVGVDKNYCREHNELGPGLLLFRRPPSAAELAVDADLGKQLMVGRTRRLPKAPPADCRWTVLRDGCRLAPWMSEIAAHRTAAKYAGVVLTWDQFVAEWRKRYPLKKRKPRTE